MNKFNLPSPVVVIDLDIVDRNINRVANEAKKANVNMRPHVKTHKSIYFAKKQLAAGAKGISVAKISEAEVMVEYGMDDILIAYPIVGTEKALRLKKLHERIKVMTILDSLEIANNLAQVGNAERPLPVLIEIDTGLHRGGCLPGEDALKLAQKVNEYEGLSVCGVFTYNGLLRLSKSRAELEERAELEVKMLCETAKLFEKNGIQVSVISGGSTPSIAVLNKYSNITEIRSGNYIFYDLSAMSLGLASLEDCALRVLATVISVPSSGAAIIDAGTKTLTSDLSKFEGYGRVIGMDDVTIVKLNEEHGFLTYNPAIRQLKIGDRIEIVPNHSCTLSNLCDFTYGIRGDEFVQRIPVEARGKNY